MLELSIDNSWWRAPLSGDAIITIQVKELRSHREHTSNPKWGHPTAALFSACFTKRQKGQEAAEGHGLHWGSASCQVLCYRIFKLMLRDWISECGMGSCMSCRLLYILETGAIRGQKGHTPSQINELYTVNQLMLCIEASKMPPKVLDSLLNFYNMAVASSMSLSSPSLGTIPSYQPQVLMSTFSSLRLFHFWATLRLLTLPVRSECAQEHFKFRKQSKTHFSHECLIRSRWLT